MGGQPEGDRESLRTEIWRKGLLFHPSPHLWLFHQGDTLFLEAAAWAAYQLFGRGALNHGFRVLAAPQVLPPELLLESTLE